MCLLGCGGGRIQAGVYDIGHRGDIDHAWWLSWLRTLGAQARSLVWEVSVSSVDASPAEAG